MPAIAKVGRVGTAIYTVDVKCPMVCPPKLDMELPSGYRCRMEIHHDGGIDLTLDSADLPDEWESDTGPLAEADAEATRIVAALCFHYAVPFDTPSRRSPVNPNRSGPRSYDVRLLTADMLWPEEEVELGQLLPLDDPTRYRFWKVLPSASGLSDPLSQYIALWGLLDIGLSAKSESEIDDYLHRRFQVPKDRPNKDQRPNSETKFTELRHRISHPADRKVDDVASLTSAAGSLLDELKGYCRTAIREEFS